MTSTTPSILAKLPCYERSLHLYFTDSGQTDAPHCVDVPFSAPSVKRYSGWTNMANASYGDVANDLTHQPGKRKTLRRMPRSKRPRGCHFFRNSSQRSLHNLYLQLHHQSNQNTPANLFFTMNMRNTTNFCKRAPAYVAHYPFIQFDQKGAQKKRNKHLLAHWENQMRYILAVAPYERWLCHLQLLQLHPAIHAMGATKKPAANKSATTTMPPPSTRPTDYKFPLPIGKWEVPARRNSNFPTVQSHNPCIKFFEEIVVLQPLYFGFRWF